MEGEKASSLERKGTSVTTALVSASMACDFELPPRIKLDHGAGTNSAETSGDSRASLGSTTGKKGPTAV